MIEEDIEFRCQYCGKKLDKENYINFSFCCNEEHEKKMEVIFKERKEKGVCVKCGNPKVVFKNTRGSYSCQDCLLRLRRLIRKLEDYKERLGW